MNRKELTKRITGVLRDNNVRKPVSTPKHVFHITDDEGNTKDFVIRKTDKSVIYTIEDVDAVLTAFLDVVKDSLSRGEEVTLYGFGTFGLKYRPARYTKKPYTNERIEVAARYVPKFAFGSQLRMSAKLYELSLGDRFIDTVSEDMEDADFADGDGE